MTYYITMPECPNCGGLDVTDDEGFYRCHDCGEVWNADDDVLPVNDEDLYEERLL